MSAGSQRERERERERGVYCHVVLLKRAAAASAPVNTQSPVPKSRTEHCSIISGWSHAGQCIHSDCVCVARGMGRRLLSRVSS